MINRTLIRLIIVQLLYAYRMNGGRTVEGVVKELLLSLTKAYDLYNYLLLLMVDITRTADEAVNEQKERNMLAHIDTPVSTRFVENRFIAQLASNTQLMSYVESRKLSWADDRKLLRKLYDSITETVGYAAYMVKETVSYDDDRNLWKKLYSNVIAKSADVDETLENKSIYWNDDRGVVDTFVLRTIKMFDEKSDADTQLVPQFRYANDQDFAVQLMRKAIEEGAYCQSLIKESAKNWEFERLADMDVVIMQVALAEVISFPDIPVSVTINEYVEAAKYYSTQKSYMYINGILDNVTKQLQKEHKILKK
jgi:transcription antitermination protein NusB